MKPLFIKEGFGVILHKQSKIEVSVKSSKKMSKAKGIIPGEEAFDLYATFGFPIELTIDLAEERGLTVDLEGYEKAKKEHSEISNQGKFAVGLKNEFDDQLNKLPETKFLGYESEEAQAEILFLAESFIVLNQTPFYAESGGQLADTGEIESGNGAIFKVLDVQKYGKVFLHKGEFINEKGFKEKEKVTATINKERRKEIRKHHTATHLLQSALRKVLGKDVQQAGSQVDSNKLRFDFTAPKAPSKEQLSEIEEIINNWVDLSLPVQTKILPYDQAIKEGALAFFGDKYEDEVRVLCIGNDDVAPISVELCGGTHVQNTLKIGLVKILSESAISAGTRRIEMLVGESFIEHVSEKAKIVEKLTQKFKVPSEELINRVAEVEDQLQRNQKQLKALEKELVQFKATELFNKVESQSGINKLIAETDLNNLKEALDFIGGKLQSNYVLFLVNKDGAKLSYAAKVSKDLHEKCLAKDLVAKFARQVGGSGGGRPDFAQGGGGDKTKIDLNNLY